jgi:hypothetical protein
MADRPPRPGAVALISEPYSHVKPSAFSAHRLVGLGCADLDAPGRIAWAVGPPPAHAPARRPRTINARHAPWQRRTNVWRELTSPARPKRIRQRRLQRLQCWFACMSAPAVVSTTESLAGDPADNETQCPMLRSTSHAPRSCCSDDSAWSKLGRGGDVGPTIAFHIAAFAHIEPE